MITYEISGKFILIDDEDVSLLRYKKLCLNGSGYAMTTKKGKPIFVHELILGRIENKIVDHINRNKLDNRRQNLRHVSYAENHRNAGPKAGRYKGISLHKRSRRWQVQITIDGKYKPLGYFSSEIEAAKAYDKSMVKNYGTDGVYLNFPEDYFLF